MRGNMTQPDTSLIGRTPQQLCWWLYGWVFIRPLRWLSHKAIMGSFGIRWLPEKSWDGWRMPNLHLWFWYKTYGKFACWLKNDAWRPFCDWTGGWRKTFPLHARIIKKIGEALVWHFHGYQCYHCSHDAGSQGDLSEDETGATFKLLETGTSATENGTDHWFRAVHNRLAHDLNAESFENEVTHETLVERSPPTHPGRR
jgi:hypothetical protein